MPKTATILRYIKIAQDDRSGRPASEMTASHAVTANTEPGFRKTNENPDQSQDDSSPVTKTGTESPRLLTAPRHRAPAATMPPQSRKSEHSSLTTIQDSNRNRTETQQKTPADQPQKYQKFVTETRTTTLAGTVAITEDTVPSQPSKNRQKHGGPDEGHPLRSTLAVT